VAVGPLVVTGRVDERVLDTIKAVEVGKVDIAGTRCAPRLDVTVVDHERESARVDLVDEVLGLCDPETS
jgi:hypothetical protein